MELTSSQVVFEYMSEESDDELPVWLRGRLESDLDDIIDDPIRFAGRLLYADVELNENSALAFVHGMMFSEAINLSSGELSSEELREVVHVVRRRRSEILGALREDAAEELERDE
jgi:hypothetical protein